MAKDDLILCRTLVVRRPKLEQFNLGVSNIYLKLHPNHITEPRIGIYRVSRQKEYTFDDLWGGRSARYSAQKYLKLTAHSSSFERGALELDIYFQITLKMDFFRKSLL